MPSLLSKILQKAAIAGLLPGVWCATPLLPFLLYKYSPVPPKYLAALYSVWYAYDFRSPFTGGWMTPWFRKLKWWELCAEHNDFKLVIEPKALKELSEGGKAASTPVIFCSHPHGVMCAGPFQTFGFNTTRSAQRIFPSRSWRVMTIKASFFVPVWREFLEMLGFIDASRSSASKALKKGHSLLLVPGGAAEALLGSHYNPELILNKRKGFIKLSIQQNAPLVPCFTFGENELHSHVDLSGFPIIVKIRKLLKKLFGITTPLLKNPGLTPWRHPITTVIGEPIYPSESASGKSEDEHIDYMNKLYVTKLEDLYEKHRKDHNYGVLKIVE
jgi:1-acyl-sn-glycerol-3-phosphate acyltransferase